MLNEEYSIPRAKQEMDIIERAVGDSLGSLDEREKEEKEIVNIYIGFSFDGDNYIPLIATTDFDRCKNHLLKMVEIGDDDYTYWMEVWSNEKRIRELFYDANEKRFVDTTDFQRYGDEESSGAYIVSLLYFGNGLKGYVYHESFETEEQAKQRCEDIMDCLENQQSKIRLL